MNTTEDLRERLRIYVLSETEPDPKAGKDMFICPLCGSGSHGSGSDGAFHLYDNDKKWKCHSCGKGGDIFSLYAELNGLDLKADFPQIKNALSMLLGVPNDDYQPERKNKKKNPDPERIEAIKKYSSNMPGSEGEEYLKKRGFSDEIIKRFHLGYDPESRAVVIPYPGTDYYTKRSIDPAADKKYINLPGEAPSFIIKENPKSDIYLVTEGQLDALSMIQAGAKNVIASHYVNKIGKLIDEGLKIEGAAIIADRDPEEKKNPKDNLTPGERTVRDLTKIFTDRGIKSISIYPPEGFKDSNDLLRDDPEKLKTLLFEAADKISKAKAIEKKQERPKYRVVNVGSYLESDIFGSDIEYFRQYKDRKTGFSNIDKYLTLYPGLACFTGSTSLGKTSFCVQLADQLIERGESVLYFSLEQLPIELVTKSLARNYYLRGGFRLKNSDIREGASDDRLNAAKVEYTKKSKQFTIVSCDFTLSADQIVNYVNEYIEKTGLKPIVIVDYLQILAAPEGERFDERGRIDDAVKKLKRLSRDKELFILVISNMARNTYREKLGEDSFKESGLIEYTCDYLFGLQLAILEDEEFFQKTGSKGGTKETLKFEKQDKIDEASEAIPKEVVFKAMKNRNGRKNFKAFFRYRPDYDLFEEDEERQSARKPLSKPI